MSFKQKVAVVTGSAKGLGKALALSLSRDKFTVVVQYNKSKNEAEAVLSQIKVSSPNSIVVCGDLTDEDSVHEIFTKILNKFGTVDLLVNNVGNFIYKKFSDTSNREFVDVLESNIYSTLFCTRAVLPVMRKNKYGNIINVGAVGADLATIREKSTPYFIAKNALYFLTKMIAWEEAGNGIHINMISPGSLVEDIFDASQFPMGRSAGYEDVVKVLRFLTSQDAYYINGANIEVAGAFIPGLSEGK